MPISLKQAGGGSSGIRLAAGQTFSALGGIGVVSVTGVNINATTNILSLSGKYLVQGLSISGLGTTGNLTLSINIDGRVIFSGVVPITQDGLSIFGSPSSANPQSHNKDSIRVENSLVITVQKASTTASVAGIVYAEF
jgi:hypothetical protein